MKPFLSISGQPERASSLHRSSFQRLKIAASAYALLLGLILLFYYLELIQLNLVLFIRYCGIVLLTQILIFTLIRSGWSQRLKDPSLTLCQMITGILLITFLIDQVQTLRGPFLCLYIFIMMFGIFQLSMKAFFTAAGLCLAAYALVLIQHWQLMRNDVDTGQEQAYWGILLVAMFWTMIFSRYVRRISDNLREQRTALLVSRDAMQRANLELEQTMAQLDRLAGTDELTGLLNRRRFFAQAETFIDQPRATQSLIFAVVDLDFFKKINDTYGHSGGDKVLISFAELAMQYVASTDVIGRYGGEEFVILFPYELPEHEAIAKAYGTLEMLRIAFEAYRHPSLDPNLRMTFSVGLTIYQDHEPLEVTFKRADEALYHAKHSGRNQICTWESVLGSS